jgi:hypothetical protein
VFLTFVGVACTSFVECRRERVNEREERETRRGRTTKTSNQLKQEAEFTRQERKRRTIADSI